jgi:hypothetical protein
MSDNIITAWREAVQAYLTAQFPEAEVLGGKRDGVSRDKARICVWWPGWPALQRDIALANPTLLLRFFPALSKQPSATSPRDEAPLEQAAVDLMVAMAAKRKAGDFVADLACYVSSCVPNDDPDIWRVDATIQAIAMNLAVVGA